MSNDNSNQYLAPNQGGVPLTKRERRRLKREGKREVAQAAVSRARRGRWGWWLLIVLILAGAVYGLYRVATRPSDGGGVGDGLSAPVTAEDWRRGPAEAAAVLVEYSDFQCPACGFYEPWIQKLSADFPTDLAVIYRHFPLKQHLNAVWSARATEAAGLQGKFWEMHDLLFDKQDVWSERLDAKTLFVDYAAELKLDLVKFKKDLNSNVTKAAVDVDQKTGTNSGVGSTPTFFLNDKLISNPKTYDDFAALIRQAATASSTASSNSLWATSTDAKNQ